MVNKQETTKPESMDEQFSREQFVQVANNTDIQAMINEVSKEHDEVRAHIEFAYLHYVDFLIFCQDKVNGKNIKIPKFK